MAKNNLVGAAYKLANIWTALVNAVRNAAKGFGMSQDQADEALGGLEAKESAPLLARLAAVILGEESEESVVIWPSQAYASDLIPEAYTVVEDVAPSDFKMEDLEFVGFLRDKEELAPGCVMRGRAVTLGVNLGLADGKKILDQQNKLPAELRECTIALTGTLLRRRFGGGPYLVCLFWHQRVDRWELSFYSLGSCFTDYTRLPRCKAK